MQLTHCEPNLKVCLSTRLAGCRPCHCPRLSQEMVSRVCCGSQPEVQSWLMWCYMMLVFRGTVSATSCSLCVAGAIMWCSEYEQSCVCSPCPPVWCCCAPLWLSGLSLVVVFLFSFSWILLCLPFFSWPVVFWIATLWIRNSDYIQTVAQLEWRTDSFAGTT